MLSSMGTNGVDQFIPSQHLSLITQPVLGARSRSKNTQTRLFIDKDKWETQTNSSQQNSLRNSPSSTISSNKIDFPFHSRRNNTTSHHESSDSGIDLSLSTSSSIQMQQHPSSQILIHRPLSALDEDSNTDDGYSNDDLSLEQRNSNYLRFPPIILGRNRSMEDMLTQSNSDDQEQHRSSSFSDDRRDKSFRRKDKQMKRSSDGVLLELQDKLLLTKNDKHKHNQRYSNDSIYRSNDDSTNKNLQLILPIHQESNVSSEFNNLSTSTTVYRKPHTLTLKPLRKKSKSNPLNEQSIPLTSSSRLHVHEQQQQMNSSNGISNHHSSNQTTPRSRRHFIHSMTNKQKGSTLIPPINDEIPTRSNTQFIRSNLDRQPLTVHSRPGVFQQVLPFDASPSKVNNLLLRHQQQTTVIQTNSNLHHGFHSSMSSNQNSQQILSVRQSKASLPIISIDETMNNNQIDQRKFRGTFRTEKSQEEDRKRSFKYRDERSISPKTQTKGKGKDLWDLSNDQSIEQLVIHRKLYASGHRQIDKDESNDFNQRKRIENGIPLVSSRQQQEQTHCLNNIRLNHRSKSNPNNGRVDSTSNIDLNSKNHEHRNRNSSQLNQQKHRLNDQYHEQKVPLTFVRHQRASINNERMINRPLEITNQNTGSDSSSATQNEIKSNRTFHQSRNNFNPINETGTFHSNRKFNPNLQLEQIRSINQRQQNKDQSDRSREQFSSRTHLESNSDREMFKANKQNTFLPTQNDEKHSKEKLDRRSSLEEFQSRSPTNSILPMNKKSDQLNMKMFDQINVHLSKSSTSSSSNDDLQDENSSTPRTYRLIESKDRSLSNDHTFHQNKFSSETDPTSQSSSRNTYPFVCAPLDDQHFENHRPKTPNLTMFNMSDREETWTSSSDQQQRLTIEDPSKVVYPSLASDDLSSDLENDDEIHLNNDQNDGWSDDSFEVIYVDEKYLSQKRNIQNNSHLSSQRK